MWAIILIVVTKLNECSRSLVVTYTKSNHILSKQCTT